MIESAPERRLIICILKATLRISSSSVILTDGIMFLCVCVLSCADVMVGMGYNLEEIQDSLAKMKYDEITATYLLLGRKASEVQTSAHYQSSTSRTVG